MSRLRMIAARIPEFRVVLCLAVLCLGLLLGAAPAIAKDAKPKKPKPHTDKQVEEAFVRFENEYKSEDVDRRLRMLRWIGHYQHKTVLKRLKGILLKETDAELQAIAAQGIGNQYPLAKDAAKILNGALKKFAKYGSRLEPMPDERKARNNEESAVLVAAIEGLGRLRPYSGKRHKNDGWKDLKRFVDHAHDDVAVAMFQYFAKTKEYRSIPVLLEWFNFYPDGYTWAGASAKVDTGAAGNKDQNAAKSKALGKAGGRSKKVRPAAWAAMSEAVKELTGKKMKKPAELKEWIKANKAMLKKHGA